MVVIGGGVVGCSVLYHLTKLGWQDVVLLERDELTSGSTWHAAGGMHTINSDPNVAKLQDYTIRLYKEIEAISGQSCGIHLTGGIMLAGTPERLDFLKTAHARGRLLGLESEFISLDEVRRRHPLIETSALPGRAVRPQRGPHRPLGRDPRLCQVGPARRGAEINRFTPVTELHAAGRRRLAGGHAQGQHRGRDRGQRRRPVGARGRPPGRARAAGARDGAPLPGHRGPAGGRARASEELPHAIDFEAEIYTRQEGKGLLLGTYEQACVPWSPKTTPADFGHELLAPDLDRIAPSLEVALRALSRRSSAPASSG